MKRLSSFERSAFSRRFREAVIFVVIFFILATGIIAAGSIFYKNYERNYRMEAQHQLQAVAELKVNELVRWRKERLADAAVFSHNGAFSELTKRFFENPADEEASTLLTDWVKGYLEIQGYNQIRLLDTQGVTRLSFPPNLQAPTPVVAQSVTEVLKSQCAQITDFYRNEADGKVYLSVLAPIFDETDTNRLQGVLSLRIDPSTALYPFIQSWPTPSRSAETLLIRREGDQVVFVNQLRFNTNPVLTVRASIANTNLPAVQAALGREGIFEGRDYRGVPVFSALRTVPDSPWFMVARRDIGEVFAPVRERLYEVMAMITVLLFATGVAIGLVWRQFRVRMYKEKAVIAETLRETNEYLESLINYANAPVVVWDAAGKITRFNHAFEAIAGRKAEEVLGKDMEILFAEKQRDQAMEIIRRAGAGNRFDLVEVPIQHADGSSRIVLWNSAPIFGPDGKAQIATIAQGQDITRRKQAEEQIRRSEVRLRALVSVLQSRVKNTQELLDHALNEVIQLTESKFGYIYFYDEDRKQFVLNTWSRDVMKECAVANPNTCYELDRTGVWGEAVRQRKPIILNDFKAGHPLKKGYPKGHVELTRFMTVPVFKGDRIVAVVGVANKASDYDDSDVLQLTLLMDAVWKSVDIKTAEAALKETLERLHVSNRDLEQFAYVASHDLQEPLRMVANYMQLLERRYKDSLDQDARDFIGYAVDGAVRMQQLIDSLLEYSRLQTRKRPFESVDLNQTLQRVLRDMEGRVLETGARVTAGVLPHVYGDAIQLGLVFQNFISNALKFYGEKPPEIHIAAEEFPDHWKITVCDNGIGIAPEHQERIFKIFQRLHSRAEYPGTGIGLAICRRIIERHGGQTGVASEPGMGSTFWFTLSKKKEA